MKKIYSVTSYPKVLCNIKNLFLVNEFKDKVVFHTIKLEFRIFMEYVHKKEYDLGLFFYKDNNIKYLKVVDGCGKIAGEFSQNIFNYFMSIDDRDVKKMEKQLNACYKEIRKNNTSI